MLSAQRPIQEARPGGNKTSSSRVISQMLHRFLHVIALRAVLQSKMIADKLRMVRGKGLLPKILTSDEGALLLRLIQQEHSGAKHGKPGVNLVLV